MKTIITSKSYLLKDTLCTKSRLNTNLIIVTIIVNLNSIFNLYIRNEEVNELRYVPKFTPIWTYGMTLKMQNKIENLLTKQDVSPQNGNHTYLVLFTIKGQE